MIYPAGALHLAQVPQCEDHIASPDVIVDDDTHEIRMYFHGVTKHTARQLTYMATSPDGLNFSVALPPIAPFYLRVVRWRNTWIGMSKGGFLSMSNNGKDAFQPLPTSAFPMSGPLANAAGDVRHVALQLDGDRLWVLFSRVGDAPEHIRLGYVDLLRPVDSWKVEASVELLRPQHDWEGADIRPIPSLAGPSRGPENALRDPAILFTETSQWLFYSSRGEAGIGVMALPNLNAFYFQNPKLRTGESVNSDSTEQKSIRRMLDRLKLPGALVQRLAQIDESQYRQRIFLMGCGRSGTWLLTSLMYCFENIQVITEEFPVEVFGVIKTVQPNVVVKRAWNSYLFLDRIPKSIGILHILRHPFDVLTSHNPTTGRKFHITPTRWLGEMRALKQLMGADRSNLLVIKYEDLVQDPQAAVAKIGNKFGLTQAKDPTQVLSEVQLPDEARLAMHGVRPIEQKSVGRYRNDPELVKYLATVIPELEAALNWVATTFNYDLSLPDK